MTALITPVCDVAAAMRVSHEKTETAVVQVNTTPVIDLSVLVSEI